MKLERMTKKQLLEEVTSLRRRVSELEACDSPGNKDEVWFRSLIENSASVYAVVDAQGQTLYESPSLEKVYGWKPEEIVGKNIFDLVHPEDMEYAAESFRELLEKPGFVKKVEIRYRHKDGSWCTIEVSGVNLLHNPAVAGVVLTSHDITERRRVEHALRETEEKFQTFTGESAYAYFETDLEGRLTFINKRVEEITGHAPEEILGTNVFDLVIEEDLERARENLAKVLTEPNDGPRDYGIKAKEGSVRELEINTLPLKTDGRIAGFMSTAHDVTERRRAEEALRETEEKFQSFINESAYAYFETDLKGNITFTTRHLEDLTGYTTEEITRINTIDLLIEEDRARAQENLKRVISEPGRVPREYRAKTKHGTILQVEVTTLPLRRDGKFVGFHYMVLDVTERRQAEEALKKSEERFRLIAENSPDYIFHTRKDGTTAYCSPAIERVLGYKPEERHGTPFTNIISPHCLERARTMFQEVLKGNPIKNTEIDLLHKDGRTVTVEVSVEPIVEEGGVTALLGVVRDVTERRRSEEALKEAEERLSAFMDSAPDVFGVMDSNLNLIALNKAGLKLYGHDARREDLIGKHVSELYPTAFEEGRFAKYTEILGAKTSVIINDLVPPPPYENARWAIRAFKAGKNIGVIISDITEQKRAEEALRESETKYRLLAENVKDVIWMLDLNLHYTYISPSVERQRGFTVEEAMKQKMKDVMTPASLEKAVKLFREELSVAHKDKDYISQRLELEVRCKDGSTIWTEVHANFLRDDSGEPVGILGVSRDITDRRKAEKALQESELKYRMLIENTNDIAYTMDAQGSLVFIGPQVRRYGIEPEDALSAGFWEHILPEDRDKLSADIEQTLTTGREFPSEFRLLDKEGRVHWMEEHGKVLRDESGQVAGISGMLRDITERKQAEEALRKSEENWRSLVENAPNIIMMVDRTGTIIFINHTVAGLSIEETIGRNQYEYIEPEHHDIVKHTIEEVYKTGQPGRYQIRGVGPDGSTSWYETNVSPVKSDDKVMAVTLIITDITERKQAEQALQQSESKYRTLIENLPQKIFIKDRNAVYVSCNENFARDLGIIPDEFAGKRDYDFFPKELADKYRTDDRRVMETGKTEDIEEEYIKDGVVTWVNTVKTPVRDDQGNVVGILGIFWDITERKRVENALKESEEKWRSLVENAPSIIIIVDLEGIIQFLNRTVSSRTIEQTIGTRIYDYASPEYHDTIRSVVEEVIHSGKPGRYETKGEGPDRHMSWYETQAGPIKSGEQVVGVILVSKDITEQKQAARRLAEAQEEERSRLSGQLHDDVGQLLTLSKIKVDRLRDARFGDMAEITKELSEVSGLLTDILEKTRDLSQALHPPLLDQFGLVSALKALAAEFRRNTGIDVTVEVGKTLAEVPGDASVLIYRVTQEALTNVAKHANADRASVSVDVGDGQAELEVIDNGKGFDVTELESRIDCLGVRNMRTRIANSGGVFSITSRISEGTTVRAIIPITTQE